MLEEAWSSLSEGRDVVVSSPPGAGKTTLVVSLATRAARARLRVVIAAPTIHGASVAAAHFAHTHLATLEGSSMPGVPGVPSARTGAGRSPIVLRTLASCRLAPPEVDLMILDEAYQATFADALVATARATRVVMVGDPGQIGPVIALDTSAMPAALSPAARAPEPLLAAGAVAHLTMPHTYRLGPKSTEVACLLYDFAFTTRRAPTEVEGRWEVESVDLGPTGSLSDPHVIRTTVAEVLDLIGSTLHGPSGTRELNAGDVAVIAARNEQVAALEAALDRQGAGGVKLGTADSLQGGQWPAVVALDPMVGAATASDHAMSLGRLCVMISRHQAQLTWITSAPDVARTLLDVPDLDSAATHQRVRQALAGEG